MADKFSLDDILDESSKKKTQKNSDSSVHTETEAAASERTNLSEDSTDESIQEINNKKAVNPVIDESELLNEGNIATYKEQGTDKINLSFESKPEKNASEKDIKAVTSENAFKKNTDENNDKNERTTPFKKLNSIKQNQIERARQEEELAKIDREKAVNAEKQRESIRNAENAAAIANLMKLKKERGSVRKKQHVTPVNRPNVKDIDLGLTGKIIPKTEEFDKAVEIPEDATFEEKTKILYQQRKKENR